MGGLLARTKRCPDKPALPSIFLSSVSSIANKTDKLRLWVVTNNIVKASFVLIFTETWLQASIPNSAVALDGRAAHRADIIKASGKQGGGGQLIFTKDSWSSNTRTLSTHCSPELEYITVKCRPTYLPREFNAMLITAVYKPPDADANIALTQLHDVIRARTLRQYTSSRGDFNHANLKVVPTLN